MSGHFVIFYIKQFYFILFMLPPAVGTLIWGNRIAPLKCMKHTLPSYVFWLYQLTLTLQSLGQHTVAAHTSTSQPLLWNWLESFSGKPSKAAHGITAELTSQPGQGHFGPAERRARSPPWHSQAPDTGCQGCVFRQLPALICTFSFSPGSITAAWAILWEH